MASRRKTSTQDSGSGRSPARSPQERENQLIELAVDLTENQLRTGEASAQVITHYLKLGSSRERLEQQRLKNEVALLQTKRETLESEQRTEALIQDAMKAFRIYSGNSPDEQEPEFDEYE